MKERIILNSLAYVAAFIIAVPLLLGILRFRRNRITEKIILLLLTLSILSESTAFYLRAHHVSNLILYHIYSVFEFSTISAYFIFLFRIPLLKKIIAALLLPFLVIAAFDIPSAKLNTSDSLTTSFEGIMTIIYCITYFYTLLQNPVYDNIFSAPPFWFVSSFLLYFAGTLFVFIFSSYITENSLSTGNLLWGINSVVAILFYLLFTVGFLKVRKR